MSHRAGAAPTLTFLGAAGSVTGSKFLVEWGDRRVLVDAGLYQGLAEHRRRNWEPFPVPADTLDAVVLTHAHLDHCGFLPRLVREGFAGPVVCTADTAALAAIVLRDSAHLQEEDARYANAAGWSRHRPALPLYDATDVERTLPLFAELDFGAPCTLVAGCTVTLQPAGHILGSATVLVEVEGRRVLFSGDLGRPSHPLLEPPTDPPPADVVVVESTYGDRVHPAADTGALADAISRTAGRGGTVLIPAFAVDRTELVLLELYRLTRTGQIPRLPVFVDSPMALRALDVYRRALTRRSPQLRDGARELTEAFDHLDLHPVRDPEQSERLNRPAYPCILVSASGMATGGRVVHHLQHQLPEPRNCVVLTGYQAIGTRGRSLLDGARALKMYGRYVPVRAEVVNVDTFSVHADADELVGWLARMPRTPATAYVVHGEPSSSAALVERLRDDLDWCAVAPYAGERVRLVRPER